jgi:hypothetical protein
MQTDEETEQSTIMAEAQKEERTMNTQERRSAEQYGCYDKDKSDPKAVHTSFYFTCRPWKNDDISKHPPNAIYCTFFYSTQITNFLFLRHPNN